MPRSRSMAIQSEVTPRRPALPCTAPAVLIADACSASASVRVDLPASGWLITANVRRRVASPRTPPFGEVRFSTSVTDTAVILLTQRAPARGYPQDPQQVVRKNNSPERTRGSSSLLNDSRGSPAEEHRLQRRLRGEHQGVGGTAESDPVAACGDAPLAGLAVEAGEQARVGSYGDLLGLARLEVHPIEAEQPHSRAVGGAGEVDLRHVGALSVAGVGDGEGGRDGVASQHQEIAVVESGVAEAVAEAVQRLLALLGEPPVANLGALAVLDRGRGAPGLAHAREVRPGGLREVGREGARDRK